MEYDLSIPYKYIKQLTQYGNNEIIGIRSWHLCFLMPDASIYQVYLGNLWIYAHTECKALKPNCCVCMVCVVCLGESVCVCLCVWGVCVFVCVWGVCM